MVVLTNFIQKDGTYDLHAALKVECKQQIGSVAFNQAVDFIERTEELVRMNKLTVAAHTLTAAVNIATSRRH